MNTYSRQRLKIRQADANTASGDTGTPFFGEIAMMRWVPTVGDSGAGLLLSLIDGPADADTGGNASRGTTGGWVFYNDEDGGLGATTYVRTPSQRCAQNDGFDTGAGNERFIVSAGQRIRAKSVPAGNGIVTGDLLFWIRS